MIVNRSRERGHKMTMKAETDRTHAAGEEAHSTHLL